MNEKNGSSTSGRSYVTQVSEEMVDYLKPIRELFAAEIRNEIKNALETVKPEETPIGNDTEELKNEIKKLTKRMDDMEEQLDKILSIVEELRREALKKEGVSEE